MSTMTVNRRYELDWLRVLAILIVFLYHSTRFFNLSDWHIKNVDTYVWVEIWVIFAARWMMPLFFIISGASLFYAIGKSGGWRRFYVDKFSRLMIPVVIGSVTHSALQIYLNQRWVSLLLGVGLSSAYLYQLFSPSRLVFPAGITDWIYTLLSFFSAWSWLFAGLGFSMRHLAFDRPLLRSANEGVMPFYILHQTVLLCIGYFVMTWEIHAAAKWVIVFISSFITIIALYRLFIQKFEFLRFLFGMKTALSFFDVLRKRKALTIVPVLFVGLIAFAVINQITHSGGNSSYMPITYNSEKDILLGAESITGKSSGGVRVVKDEEASRGQAIEFFSGANEHAESQPKVYMEMRFSAPPGRYIVWLRGKTDINSVYTDSVWVQVDDQIGTQTQSVRMGNWLDVHPAGVYGWAGDTDDPVSVVLKHTGDHTIRIQPRQIPHRIDQIWLSRSQHQLPNTSSPIK